MKWMIAVTVNGIDRPPRPDPLSGTGKFAGLFLRSPEAAAPERGRRSRGDHSTALDSDHKSTCYQHQRGRGCQEVAILADISLRIRGKPLP
jgi:hypothetical protein